MKAPRSDFILPPVLHNSAGKIRTVGFELEFSGIALRDTVEVVCAALQGEIGEATAAEVCVKTDIGDVNVEIDWAFLKEIAADGVQVDDPSVWLQSLSELAALLVPIEVVCPPLPMTSMGVLDGMVSALRKAGAVGTEASLVAAYGVHINPEIPAIDAATIHRYLRAFGLLQWWLVESNSVDIARRLSPYIDLFDEAYIALLLTREAPDMDTLMNDYLEHNPTRNRALDMLPMFAEIDAARVRAAVDDPKIKPRPTFHYRLPNCHIEDPRWNLAHSWNLWCVVERLADDEASLARLGEAFIAADRPILGVDRQAWVARMSQWIESRV